MENNPFYQAELRINLRFATARFFHSIIPLQMTLSIELLERQL